MISSRKDLTVYVHPCLDSHMTTTNHTHRFDDNAICERCGATYAEVVSARQAAATEAATPASRARRDLDAVAKENDRKDCRWYFQTASGMYSVANSMPSSEPRSALPVGDRAANRRSYYERTGR